jgi:hypothetical protein
VDGRAVLRPLFLILSNDFMAEADKIQAAWMPPVTVNVGAK